MFYVKEELMSVGWEMLILACSENTWHLHFGGTLLWVSALSNVLCVSADHRKDSEFAYVKKAGGTSLKWLKVM